MQGHVSGRINILTGAKHVTIAATGVLLEEATAAQLEVHVCIHIQDNSVMFVQVQ